MKIMWPFLLNFAAISSQLCWKLYTRMDPELTENPDVIIRNITVTENTGFC